MIFYRGKGPLGIFISLLGALICLGIASALNAADSIMTVGAGIGLILGGIGAFFLGRRWNQQLPAQKFADFELKRGAEISMMVDSGQFRFSPEAPAPASPEEARQQANNLLARDLQRAKMVMFNQNTIYGIGMEWWSVLAAIGGVFVIVMALIG